MPNYGYFRDPLLWLEAKKGNLYPDTMRIYRIQNSRLWENRFKNGRVDEALALLSTGMVNVNMRDEHGTPALCLAVEAGSVSVLEALLKRGAVVVSTKPPETKESLHHTGFAYYWLLIRACLVDESILSVLVQMVVDCAGDRLGHLLRPATLLTPFGAQIRHVFTTWVALGFAWEVLEDLFALTLVCISIRLCSRYAFGWVQNVCAACSHSAGTGVVTFQLFLQIVGFITVAVLKVAISKCWIQSVPASVNEVIESLFKCELQEEEMALLLLPKLTAGVVTDSQRLWFWAGSRGYIRIVSLLLQREPKLVDIRDESWGYEPLIFIAISIGNVDLVELLLRNGARTDLTDSQGDTPLLSLSRRDDLMDIAVEEKLMRHLLNFCSDPAFRTRTHDGKSALSLVCQRKDTEPLVMLLLESGARNALYTTDDRGRTALHYASHNHSRGSRIVKVLIESGADVNAMDADGHTPLWWVASWGYPETVYELVQYGAEVDKRGWFSSTPLMEACVHNGTEVIEALLHHGADINVICMNNTPLGITAERKNAKLDPDLVPTLLNAGALAVTPGQCIQPLIQYTSVLNPGLGEWTRVIINHGKGSFSQAVLDQALTNLCFTRYFVEELERLLDYKTMIAIIEAGASCKIRMRRDITVLHALCASEPFESSSELDSALRCVLKHGGDADSQDQEGQTALHYAAAKGNKVALSFLLNHGATVDPRDKSLRTPLHVACQAEAKQFTQDTALNQIFLTEYQTLENPQFEGVRGQAALGFESRRRYNEVKQSGAQEDNVVSLLLAGADAYAVDSHGRIPLHYACEKGNLTTARPLLRGIVENTFATIAEETQLVQRTWKYSTAKMLSAQDKSGKTSLHLAAANGQLEVVEQLLDSDMKFDFDRVKLIYHDLDKLSEEDLGRIFDEKLNRFSHVSMKRELTDYPAWSEADLVNAQDNDGFTAIHWAVHNGCEDVVKHFHEKVDVTNFEMKSNDGRTPYQMARHPVMEYLRSPTVKSGRPDNDNRGVSKQGAIPMVRVSYCIFVVGLILSYVWKIFSA